MAGYTNKFFKYWYNSSTIEDYLTILTNENPTSHFFSVDFLKKFCEEGIKGIVRWVKKPILDMNSILFPINVGHHWIIIVVYLKSKAVVCYDGKHRNHQHILSKIKTFLTDWENHSSVQPSAWWTLHGTTPTQYNNDDCGPWILAIAKCVALAEPICFTEKDMPQLRLQQYQSIMSNTMQLTTPTPRTTPHSTTQITTPPPKTTPINTTQSDTPPPRTIQFNEIQSTTTATTHEVTTQIPPTITAITPAPTIPHPTNSTENHKTRDKLYVSKNTKRRNRLYIKVLHENNVKSHHTQLLHYIRI
ncbi:unnamed protein product [Macrosiphum euphorbiae]|uniref:Ubiquitin-like protease family profile domain-containing protein n=1 Tax=Macrosiphum euphorbiae TaxID=13131 RepID=A0AAV0Y2P3_9HEMI|nr:unnamed protein product [Macrosiphum euphorbiae]